jgi:hypothetical protein
MSNVRSRQLVNGAAPLDRSMLDSAASPVRVLFGALFLGWSWISTIIIVGRFLAPVLPGALLQVAGDSYVVAFGLAVLVTAAEFVSAGRWPVAWWSVLLVFDASFTSWQTHAWLALIVAPHMTPPGTLTPGIDVAIWLVAVVGGIIAAIFGELLLFGPRRH